LKNIAFLFYTDWSFFGFFINGLSVFVWKSLSREPARTAEQQWGKIPSYHHKARILWQLLKDHFNPDAEKGTYSLY